VTEDLYVTLQISPGDQKCVFKCKKLPFSWHLWHHIKLSCSVVLMISELSHECHLAPLHHLNYKIFFSGGTMLCVDPRGSVSHIPLIYRPTTWQWVWNDQCIKWNY